MIKTTGEEFWRFYDDNKFFPDGAWHDDEVLTVGGITVMDYDHHTIPDDAVVTIDGGVIFMASNDDEGLSFELQFRRWRKEQSSIVMTFNVPKGREKEIREAVKKALAVKVKEE